MLTGGEVLQHFSATFFILLSVRHSRAAGHCGVASPRAASECIFFSIPHGEKAMSLLDFFTGRSADELVQYEPTSEDTITFGLRLFTVGGLAAIAIPILALRYFA